MRRILPVLLASVALAGFSAPASAEIEKYLLDKPHTQVMFFVDHLGFAKSSGKFLDYTGEIMLDSGNPAASSVDVTIQTVSIEMGDKTWNEHLSAEKWFNVATYPTMTFKSTKVEVSGEHTANVTGDLTLHGVTKLVTLAVTHNKSGKHPFMNRMETGFSATATIKRSEFGMTEAVPMVGDDVEIRIEAEAYKDDPAAAGVDNK